VVAISLKPAGVQWSCQEILTKATHMLSYTQLANTTRMPQICARSWHPLWHIWIPT